MGSGASAGHHPRGDPPHDELGRFMALVDSERHEKQWLAKQYDTKCREAAQLRQELEALYQRLYDGDGAAHRRGASTSMPLVKEEDGPASPMSPSTIPSGGSGLCDRRGLHLSLDTRPAPNAQREKAAKVSEDAPKSPEKQDRRRSLELPKPSALAEARRRRNSALGSPADAEFLGGLSIQVVRSHADLSDLPPSPKGMLRSQKTWAAWHRKAAFCGLKTVLELREPCEAAEGTGDRDPLGLRGLRHVMLAGLVKALLDLGLELLLPASCWVEEGSNIPAVARRAKGYRKPSAQVPSAVEELASAEFLQRLRDGGPQAERSEDLPDVDANWVAENANETARNVVTALCQHRFGEKVTVDEVIAGPPGSQRHRVHRDTGAF
ncbi:unnamed protein product [Durusdinium trenchii]|uniref:Uncharacterized protein n=1 Tax=Durusdinium trenchii TaxID=1381693 RepID=A0ABP0I692_9DINO